MNCHRVCILQYSVLVGLVIYDVLMFAEVSVKVLAILSKISIDGSIGNTFLMKYRYRYWHYFRKVLLTTLAATYM